MLKNRRIFVILTNYRISEKILNLLIVLSKDNIITLYLIGNYSKDTLWVGDNDIRFNFINLMSNIDIIYGSGISYHGDKIKSHSYIEYSNYDFVIYDDNRLMNDYKIPDIFREFDIRGIPVIGNSHGNQDINISNLAFNRSYHYLAIFGKYEYNLFPENLQDKLILGGIPNNDILKNYSLNEDHILFISNFLGNRSSPFKYNLDSNMVNELQLNRLSELYQLPIKIKLKGRLDQPNIKRDIDYVNSIGLSNYDILFDCDIENVISNSKFVISCMSTLAFKSIQMGIPTILINSSGQTGNFKLYNNIINLGDDVYERINIKQNKKWIGSVIEGGDTFNSTNLYINNLIKAIN